MADVEAKAIERYAELVKGDVLDWVLGFIAARQHRHTAAECGGIPGSIEHGIACGKEEVSNVESIPTKE